MRFEPLAIEGTWRVAWEPHVDERGWFTRTFDAGAMREHGLDPHVEQCSVSFNRLAGTLRGLHHQVGEAAETKLIRCSRGQIFDVLVDLRPASPTHRHWVGVTLDADTLAAVVAPAGVAHGFLTLADDTEVTYAMSTAYNPAASEGVRYDDPAFAIEWPAPPVVISERDLSLPPYER